MSLNELQLRAMELMRIIRNNPNGPETWLYKIELDEVQAEILKIEGEIK